MERFWPQCFGGGEVPRGTLSEIVSRDAIPRRGAPVSLHFQITKWPLVFYMSLILDVCFRINCDERVFLVKNWEPDFAFHVLTRTHAQMLLIEQIMSVSLLAKSQCVAAVQAQFLCDLSFIYFSSVPESLPLILIHPVFIVLIIYGSWIVLFFSSMAFCSQCQREKSKLFIKVSVCGVHR